VSLSPSKPVCEKAIVAINFLVSNRWVETRAVGSEDAGLHMQNTRCRSSTSSGPGPVCSYYQIRLKIMIRCTMYVVCGVKSGSFSYTSAAIRGMEQRRMMMQYSRSPIIQAAGVQSTSKIDLPKHNAYEASHLASCHDIQRELRSLQSDNRSQILKQKTSMGYPSAWSAKHLLVATSLHHDLIFPRSENACDAPQSGSSISRSK